MSDDLEIVRKAVTEDMHYAPQEEWDAAEQALDRIESRLASLTEENERLKAVVEAAKEIRLKPVSIATAVPLWRALDALSPGERDG